jgi:hypothetical protein
MKQMKRFLSHTEGYYAFGASKECKWGFTEIPVSRDKTHKELQRGRYHVNKS